MLSISLSSILLLLLAAALSLLFNIRATAVALMETSPSESAAPILPTVLRPKSPPHYPDISGRHRLQVEVQALNREILFLEEELKSLEDALPASRCCKEVEEFVRTNADPLTAQEKKRKSRSFLKSLGSKLFCSFPWLPFSCARSLRPKKPRKCAHDRSNNCCSAFHWCSSLNSSKKCCTFPHCNYPRFSCPKCSCGCVWYCCPSCTKQKLCCCAQACCSSHCLC